MIVVARQEWQHSGISKILFCRHGRGVSVVEGDQETLVQVASRWRLVEDVLGESFGHLVDIEILDLLAPNVENRLGDPQFELAAIARSYESEEVVVELG